VIEGCDISLFPAGLASVKGIFDEIRGEELIPGIENEGRR